MKKKFGLLMLISTGILLGLTGCGAEKLDMNQFVTYEFVGYDGYGTIVSEFDDEKFEEQIVLLSAEDKNIDEDDAHDIVDSSTFSEAIEGEWTDLGSLSNGGKTTFKWSMPDSYKEKIEEKTGVRLVTDDYQVEVEGLKDPADFNIANYISFSTEGIAPKAELYVSKSDELKNWPKFGCNKRTNLSNGDVVEITIGKSEKQYNKFRKENGLPEFEQTISYTVEGLEERITSADQVSGDLLEALKVDSQGAIDKKMEKGTYGLDEADECSLVAMGYRNTNNDDVNMVMMIYKIHIPFSYRDVTYYVPIIYTSLTTSTDKVANYREDLIPVYSSMEKLKEDFSKGRYLNYGEIQIIEM